jgi:hypothetical protein
MTIRPELPNLEDLSAAELRSLVVSLLEIVAQLEAKVAALTEENARLKGLKGRPTLKSSGMEKGEFSKSGGDHPGFGAARCRIRSGR